MPPFGLVIPPSGGVWDACAACDFAQASRSEFFLLPFGHWIPSSGGAWDACAARSKAGPVMGLRPLLGPPCIPPRSTPKEGLSTSLACEGNAAIAAGASLTRYARSGDLPPRRVNARVRFRFGQTPFQPTTIDAIAGSRNAFVPFQLFQDVLTPRTWEKSNCITNMAASFTLPVVMVIAFQP